MKMPSNTFCYTVLEAVIKSEAEREITETLQKQVIQYVRNLAKFYFTVDFQLINFGIDYGAPNSFRQTHIRLQIRRSPAAEGSNVSTWISLMLHCLLRHNPLT